MIIPASEGAKEKLKIVKVQNSVPPEADRREFSSHFRPNFSGQNAFELFPE